MMCWNDKDPMCGFYDRQVKDHPDHILLIRNLAALTLAWTGTTINKEQIDKLKQHCINMGYGTKESMNIILPENL